MNPFQDVKDFHDKFGVPSPTRPVAPASERTLLRWRLIDEETNELFVALGLGLTDDSDGHGEICVEATPNLPEVADAIADAIYVLIGTAHEFGIPLENVWDAVHASNLKKVGGATREDGKRLKPDGWEKPDIEGILVAHGWER